MLLQAMPQCSRLAAHQRSQRILSIATEHYYPPIRLAVAFPKVCSTTLCRAAINRPYGAGMPKIGCKQRAAYWGLPAESSQFVDRAPEQTLDLLPALPPALPEGRAVFLTNRLNLAMPITIK